MSKINGHIEHWALADDNVNYLIMGQDGKQRQESLACEELLDPENEEWLDRTLDLDDDDDSLEDFLDDSGDNKLDPDDPRSKLIEKLKEKSGYNDKKNELLEKYGFPTSTAAGANYVIDPTVAHDAALAEDAARDASMIASNAADPVIAGEAATTAAEAEALVDTTIAAGASETGLAGILGAWLWPVTLVIIVIVVIAGLALAIYGIYLSNKNQGQPATPATPSTTSTSSSVGGAVASAAYAEYKKNVREKCDNGCDPNIRNYQQAGGGCYGGPWCAGFVSYVYKKAGATGPKTCGARMAIDYFLRSPHKQYDIDKELPQVGDVVYRPRSGGTGHVGIVYQITGTKIITIEGNSGDAVVMRTYSNYGRNSWTLLGRY